MEELMTFNPNAVANGFIKAIKNYVNNQKF